jgi:TRAP-type uncharacterized transport system substrate-binding protein
MLETASEIVGMERWPYLQARISVREQGSEHWPVVLFASDSPATLTEVADGKVQMAILNPSMLLNLAVKGTGPFRKPVPLAAVAVIPSEDQMVFAVAKSTGLKSLTEVRERRFPLKLSLRGQKDHSLHVIIKEVLAAAGMSLDDIISWGGEVRYDPGMPYESNRLGAFERGEIDAIFDEAATAWGNRALRVGMDFLTLEESLIQRLEALGFLRATLRRSQFPGLANDVVTLDFSGWPIYTRSDTSDEVVTVFCRALVARKDRIPWQGDGPLPIELMVRDTSAGPLKIPLHSAAEHFWRTHGYLR